MPPYSNAVPPSSAYAVRLRLWLRRNAPLGLLVIPLLWLAMLFHGPAAKAQGGGNQSIPAAADGSSCSGTTLDAYLLGGGAGNCPTAGGLTEQPGGLQTTDSVFASTQSSFEIYGPGTINIYTNNSEWTFGANGSLSNSAGPLQVYNGSQLAVGAIIAAGTAATLTGTGACATITNQKGGAWGGSAECTGSSGATTFVIAPGATAPNGWNCKASYDSTTQADTATYMFNTTSCTLTFAAVAQDDVIVFSALTF